MNDELDVLRPPVAVGERPQQRLGHPAIDARTIVAQPRVARFPAAPMRPPSAPSPPDPLGVLDAESSRVLRPVEPPPGRRRWLVAAAAAGLVAVAVVPALVVARRDDSGSTSTGLVAGTTPPATAPSDGTAEITAVRWGPDPGVCPDDDAPCYAVEVLLAGHQPGRRLDLACDVPDRPAPAGTTVSIDDDGSADVRLPCATNRAARSIAVTVDGETAATVDLPTTIAPTPTVTFTNDRPADQPGCGNPACRFVDVSLAGFDPGAEVTVSCVGEVTGPFAPTVVTIGPDGTATEVACYFGYPGERFWVEAGDVRSSAVTWPTD